MNLNDKVKDFTAVIMNTREYIELKQAHSSINKNPGLKKKVEEIKKKQQELLMQYKPGQNNLEPKILEINAELKNILVFPEANRYFAAGNNFNLMISKIYTNINEAIECDLKNM
jgi:cell fate (sporulation/competence/biofilm development) regulator YmcA (YheA/YmcA/DUF963 family)